MLIFNKFKTKFICQANHAGYERISNVKKLYRQKKNNKNKQQQKQKDYTEKKIIIVNDIPNTLILANQDK